MSQSRGISPSQRRDVTNSVIEHIKNPLEAVLPLAPADVILPPPPEAILSPAVEAILPPPPEGIEPILPPSHNFNNTSANPDDFEQYKATLYQMIMHERPEKIDAVMGIESNFSKINGNPVWLRRVSGLTDTDAAAKEQQTKAFLLNYKRLMYAYLSATLTVAKALDENCNQNNIVTAVAFIKANLDSAFETILSDPESTANSCEEKILAVIGDAKWQLIELLDNQLAAVNVKKFGVSGTREVILGKMLDQAKDWVGIEQPTLPIYTIFDIPHHQLATREKSRRFLIADEPCTQLTALQVGMIETRHQQKWFTTLPRFQQKMIDCHAAMILQGDRALPSQLRSVLPFMRNAYRQVVYIENAQGEWVEQVVCHHSGTAVYLRHDNKPIAGEVTQENLYQQKLLANADISLTIALNSQLADTVVGTYKRFRGEKYDPDDSMIVEETTKAASSSSCKIHNIHSAKLCLNGFRNFEFNDYTGIIVLFDGLKGNIASLELMSNLDEETTTVIAEIRRLIKEAADLADRKIWNDSDIKSTDILYKITRAVTLNNRLVDLFKNNVLFQDGRLKKFAVWIGCASGENRTGLAYYHIMRQAIVDNYRREGVEIPDNNSPIVKQISDIIADSHHVHILTGGTFGTEGIRGKSAGSAKPYDPKEKLITSLADMKSIRPCHAALSEAITELNDAIKQKLNDPLAKHMLPYAMNLHQYALEKQKDFFYLGMTKQDREIFIESLQVTTAVIRGPKQAEIANLGRLISKLDTQAKRHELHPALNNDATRSARFMVLGCLLGIASVLVAAVSLAGFLGTFGVATPLSSLGLVFAGTLAKAATASVAAAACATAVSSTLFYHYGAHQHKNMHRNLDKLYEISVCQSKPTRRAEAAPRVVADEVKPAAPGVN